ncbi:PEP/pyruvate-binding domain-containing protein [Halobacterium wangiae]|uniref:PEP/pyruvate-binding domain-containing protein n=1 Tax=Halobacterium wangiae TaxID=2902623 RepID=UPI001E402732|nr:PEP/pyruvate-binding domain-containing protein [Halobacterium wangiae]
MSDQPRGQFIVWFDDQEAEDLGVTGGKGANLAVLAGAGLPVPPGFVITTAAYHDLVTAPGIQAAVERLDAVEASDSEGLAAGAAEVRSLIRARTFDAAVETAEAVASLDADRFAVRSSATAEDLPGASFAGQHETFLGVRSGDVPNRVRECMASLFTDRAVAYRARNGVEHASVEMAVVVQPMVDAAAAGVLFTADPASGNRRVAAVDASYGLGESVVSGEVTPDHALVHRETGEVQEYRVGTKTFAVEVDRSETGDGVSGADGDVEGAGDVGESENAGRDAAESGTRRVEVSPERRDSRVLTDEQLRTLVGLGERAETLLEAPQDVEWALVDGRFVLLQSRPITSLFPVPSPAPEDDRLHVYVSMGHMQAMPEAMPPLVRDVWRTYTANAFSTFGVDANLTVEAGGRVYIDVTPFLRRPGLRSWLVGRIAAINDPISAGLEDVVSRRPEEFGPGDVTLGSLPGYAATTGRLAALLGPALPRIAWHLLGALGGREPPVDEETWALIGDMFVGSAQEAQTTEERARAVFEPLDFGEFFREVYPRLSPLFLAFGLGGWLMRTFPDNPEDVNAVGRGFERDVVTRINLGLGDLADVARAHPSVATALREGVSLADLMGVEGGEAFCAAFEDFLDEFGHRATGEIDLSRPRWREDPSVVLAVVRANLAVERRGEHRDRIRGLVEEAEAAASRLEARADYGLFGPLRRRYVRWLIRTYRETVYLREYPKQEAARAFTAWRDALLDAGDQLVDEGSLDRREDVWFLRRDELVEALDGADAGEGDGVAVDVAGRRREHDRNASLVAPPVLTSEGETVRGGRKREVASESTLVGTGVSDGVVEGVARVVRDPAVETVERGEILVAPSTDPGWTPLFLNAAGLVSEVGGHVSHGALVAREYGLPAVVSVADATTRIQTGDRLRIDGGRGTVELLDVSEGSENAG